MQEQWVVIDQFGNEISAPFFDRWSAEQYAKNIPQARVIKKN